MFNTTLNTATRTLHIEFPAGLRKRTVSIPVTSTHHAINLYNSNVAKYIIATLTRWVNHRDWTIKYIGEMTPAREYAIASLKTMLANYSESTLHVIILQVVKHEDDILKLAPGEQSRYYQKYLHSIVGIRHWCREEYDRMYHPELKNRV